MAANRIFQMACVSWMLVLMGVSLAEAAGEASHVYLVAFMNITTDRDDLKVLQEFYVSSNNKDVNFRAERPLDGLDQILSLNQTNRWRLESHLVRDFSVPIGVITSKMALKFTTDKKMNVVVSKETSASTDTVFVLPLTKEGRTFYVPSYSKFEDAFAGLVIAAAEDGICVEVTQYHADGSHGRIAFFDMDDFSVYQLMSDKTDVTGFEVYATGAVAVFGGHECAQVPAGTAYCDHIYSQTPPTTEWGKDHVVPPILYRDKRAGYEVRILGMEDGTVVTCTCEDSCVIRRKKQDETDALAADPVNKGRFMSCINDAAADKAMSVQCTKPCQVVQYNRSWRYVNNRYGTTTPDTYTDPFMTIIPPVDHYDNDMTYSTPYFLFGVERSEFLNVLAVVVKTTDKDGVRLDGQTIIQLGETWKVSPLAGYSYFSVQVGIGYHYLVHTDPAVLTLMGLAYGHSNQHSPTAYGQPTGYRMLGALYPGDWGLAAPTTEPPVLRQCDGVPEAQKPAIIGTKMMDVEFFNRVSQPCRSKHEAAFKKITEQIVLDLRKRMCALSICQQLKYSYPLEADVSFINRNTNSVLVGAAVNFIFEIGMDEMVEDWLTCKKQIKIYLNQKSNWYVPQNVAGCPVLDFGRLACREPQTFCDVAMS